MLKHVEELNIRLNKNTGEWDWDILANDWEVDDLLAWGFTEEELSIFCKAEAEANEESTETLEPCSEEDAKTQV